ncbi:hypothetical protein Y032_1196g3747 [Ancylostoma ceylanicum]|uniref:Uncharacterized protein n=1 Tax=Ancylostoma ceylanicum TaxID=53326 RepID=A0A016W7M7_9BILA|nr:hypothetical protein Y032_1196g3747 [Ancylostoma ceylanicum]
MKASIFILTCVAAGIGAWKIPPPFANCPATSTVMGRKITNLHFGLYFLGSDLSSLILKRNFLYDVSLESMVSVDTDCKSISDYRSTLDFLPAVSPRYGADLYGSTVARDESAHTLGGPASNSAYSNIIAVEVAQPVAAYGRLDKTADLELLTRERMLVRIL